ncbi:transferase family-domain-containing protein [Daldinia caldariorum]|uniref:transferase family-domain-containing protein n=1 Tax=Daldinia caldariorum TaxID=326644 RepID=UPI0020082E9A|nr:transferase family-domain-containing protein [Daldinia caldariorum]KAI1470881.1 transferase family-domain-containing protein [Daldinia caldariorum]
MVTLSPLDKIMPRGYVRQIFLFPSTHAYILDTLRKGLGGVVNDVPYLLSGILVGEDPKHVSLSDPYQTLEDLCYEQDLSDTIDYAAIKEQHFPPSALAVPGIIPPDTQPPFPSPAPVFRAGVSLVNGGFILCVAVHHCTTDITGFGALLKIWASHCRAGTTAGAGFDPSWLSREALIGRSNSHNSIAPTSMPKLLHIREPDKHARRTGSVQSPPSDLTTGIFFFPQSKLQALKHAVNEHIASQDGTGWISTGDILTALLWSATLAAEQQVSVSAPGVAAEQKSTHTIGIPANFRSRLNPPLPPNYLGAAFVMTAATAPRADLISFATESAYPPDYGQLDSALVATLAVLASTIRASLRSVHEQSVRDVLVFLNLNEASKDHPSITLGPRHDGISIVSWADQGVYELDWGEVVGRCEAVRLPKLASKRYPIVLPRIPSGLINGEEGGLEVIVSFDRQVLLEFEQSWPIRKFATVRCRS